MWISDLCLRSLSSPGSVRQEGEARNRSRNAKFHVQTGQSASADQGGA